MALAGGIRDPLGTCSSFIIIITPLKCNCCSRIAQSIEYWNRTGRIPSSNSSNAVYFTYPVTHVDYSLELHYGEMLVCEQSSHFSGERRKNNLMRNLISSPVKSNMVPVVQSIVSLTSSLRVILLTVLADSIHNILIFFAEKMWVHFFQQKISAYLRITRCKF